MGIWLFVNGLPQIWTLVRPALTSATVAKLPSTQLVKSLTSRAWALLLTIWLYWVWRGSHRAPMDSPFSFMPSQIRFGRCSPATFSPT